MAGFRVYVLLTSTPDDYRDGWILGVYSSKTKAQEAAEAAKGSYPWCELVVDEHALDQPSKVLSA